MNNKTFQLTASTGEREGLMPMWVATGQKNQPLVCIWIDANSSSGREPQTRNENPAGLCVCA